MKKIVIFAILACVLTAFAFASDFTVQTVTGSVEREAGNQRVAVKAGEALASDAVIHTGKGASLVVRAANGRVITVPAEQNGTLADLTRPGVRIGGNVSQTNTDVATRTTTGAATASARASDAAGDDDIAAE